MSDELTEVRVLGMADDRLGYDFILLGDESGRQMPIWVGRCDALALVRLLRGVVEPRPMTHHLLCNCVERLGGQVTRLVIDDLWQNVFYAKLCVAPAGGEEFQADCRPADGLAMALRVGAPILVRDEVLEEAKISVDLDDGDLDPDLPDAPDDEEHDLDP